MIRNSSLFRNSRRLYFVNLRKMHIIPVPVLKDNYAFIIHDTTSGKGAVVDPVEPAKVISVIKKVGVDIKAIINTHHHWDHAGGNEEFLASYPKINVYGSDDRITRLTNSVKDGEKFKIGNLEILPIFTPCHTSGSMCYYIEDKEDKVVFTGDTLFIGGCGRFFEGTAEQMVHALCDKLGKLPPDTKVYCGHEYTVSNIKFAMSVEKDNKDIKDKLNWAMKQDCTVPSLISEEWKINPFMRVRTQPELLKSIGVENEIAAMKKLREMKNSF